MRKISYAQSVVEIEKLDKLGVDEIIVSTRELSRFAKNTYEELLSFISYKKNIKAKLILEWDILMQEGLFAKTAFFFERLPLHEFSTVRLQDPGAINLVKDKYPWLKIQLILETGNHNLVGQKRFIEFLGPQLERLILSNELSKEHLIKYCKEISVPIEVLVFGRILLFYSPRELITPVINKKNDYIEIKGTSEESPHTGFPIIENVHGTFMFNVKDLSLIEHLDELNETGVAAVRYDFRYDDFFEKAHVILNNDLAINEKIIGPRPFIKGFYNINKTDVLFVKLKNRKIARSDQGYIGEIVDVERDKQLCLLLKNNIEFNEFSKIKIITPEGKEKIVKNYSTKNSRGDLQLEFKKEEIALISYISGVTVKSQVYFDSSK